MVLCLFFNACFSQESHHEKHTIILHILVDSLGTVYSTTFVPDSSDIKGLEQRSINKMVEIAQRKVKTLQFPASKFRYKQSLKFDFITVGGGKAKEQLGASDFN